MARRGGTWRMWGAIGLIALAGASAPGRAGPAGPFPAAGAAAPAHKLQAAPHRVFHLNCGTLAPPSAWLVNGEGGLFDGARLVNHCLLIETSEGLVLVDTGLGRRDVASPDARFSWGWFALVRPRLERAETAADQIEKLGFRAADVTDIVLTHLDVDHVGGLADFPQARVHLSAREHARLSAMAGGLAPLRWAHGPRWVPHALEPSSWHGLDSAPVRPGMRPEVRLVGLPGHTAGHAGVAVRQGAGWLLHAGDAYYHRGEIAARGRHCPPALEAMLHLHGFEAGPWAASQRALRRLAARPDVRVIGAHDPREWVAAATEGLLPKLAAAGR